MIPGIGPGWLTDVFAAIALGVAAFEALTLLQLARSAAGRLTGPAASRAEAAGAHVVMGVAMAGLLVADLHFLPSGFWEVVFGLVAVAFAYRLLSTMAGRPGRPGPAGSDATGHLLAALALVYVYASPNPGGTRADFLVLPMVFLFALLAVAVVRIDALASTTAATAGTAATTTAPAATRDPLLGTIAFATVCVTLGYLLVLVL